MEEKGESVDPLVSLPQVTYLKSFRRPLCVQDYWNLKMLFVFGVIEVVEVD